METASMIWNQVNGSPDFKSSCGHYIAVYKHRHGDSP